MATSNDKPVKYFKDVEQVMCTRGKKKDGSASAQLKGWTLSGKYLITITSVGPDACRVTFTEVSLKPFPKTDTSL